MRHLTTSSFLRRHVGRRAHILFDIVFFQWVLLSLAHSCPLETKAFCDVTFHWQEWPSMHFRSWEPREVELRRN